MKSHYVCDLQDGQAVTSFFLVGVKEIRTSQRSGKSWLELALRDRTGSIPAKMWDNFEALAKTFEADDVVQIRGRVKLYNGQKEMTLEQIVPAAERDYDLADFLAHTKHDVEKLYAELGAAISGVGNPWIKRLLESVVNDPAIAPKLKRAPAAMSMHHAFVGGLLEHTVSLIGLERAVTAHYPELDADVLLAGIVLHDIGKIEELSYERATNYTYRGPAAGAYYDRHSAGAREDQGDSRFSRAARDSDRAFNFEPPRNLRIWLAVAAADARGDCSAFSGRHGFENGGDARDPGRRVGQRRVDGAQSGAASRALAYRQILAR